MSADSPLTILDRHRDELSALGVKSLKLFGSVVRDEARADSDIDILVEFSRPIGLLAFVRLKQRLAELLGRSVDLVTAADLKPQMRDHILHEAQIAGQGLEI